MAEPRVWGGQTAAARAAGRRERLVETALDVIGESGVGGTTVREVCRRAGLNPRYFYESFEDLDALLVAVFDGILEETVAVTLAAIASAPDTDEDKTRAALNAAFRHLTGEPRRIRFLLAETLGHPALAQRRTDAVRTAAGLMADQAAAFYGLDRNDRLLRSTTFMLTGGIIQMLIAWHDGSLDVGIDELVGDAVALTVGTSRAAGKLARDRGD